MIAFILGRCDHLIEVTIDWLDARLWSATEDGALCCGKVDNLVYWGGWYIRSLPKVAITSVKITGPLVCISNPDMLCSQSAAVAGQYHEWRLARGSSGSSMWRLDETLGETSKPLRRYAARAWVHRSSETPCPAHPCSEERDYFFIIAS